MLVLQLQAIAQLCSSYAIRYQNDSGNTPFKQSIIRLFRSKILILEMFVFIQHFMCHKNIC